MGGAGLQECHRKSPFIMQNIFLLFWTRGALKACTYWSIWDGSWSSLLEAPTLIDLTAPFRKEEMLTLSWKTSIRYLSLCYKPEVIDIPMLFLLCGTDALQFLLGWSRTPAGATRYLVHVGHCAVLPQLRRSDTDRDQGGWTQVSGVK